MTLAAATLVAGQLAGMEPGWMHPIALAEIDYRVFVAEEEAEDGFALSRLHLGLASAPTEWLTLTLVGELAGEHVAPHDAIIRVQPLDWLAVAVGYQRSPFFITAHAPLALAKRNSSIDCSMLSSGGRQTQRNRPPVPWQRSASQRL